MISFGISDWTLKMIENIENRDLGTILRELADKGELCHISVHARSRNAAVIFSASYIPSSKFGQGFGESDDPVAAIREAVANYKPTRKKRRHEPAELPDPTA